MRGGPWFAPTCRETRRRCHRSNAERTSEALRTVRAVLQVLGVPDDYSAP